MNAYNIVMMEKKTEKQKEREREKVVEKIHVLLHTIFFFTHKGCISHREEKKEGGGREKNAKS